MRSMLLTEISTKVQKSTVEKVSICCIFVRKPKTSCFYTIALHAGYQCLCVCTAQRDCLHQVVCGTSIHSFKGCYLLAKVPLCLCTSSFFSLFWLKKTTTCLKYSICWLPKSPKDHSFVLFLSMNAFVPVHELPFAQDIFIKASSEIWISLATAKYFCACAGDNAAH